MTLVLRSTALRGVELLFFVVVKLLVKPQLGGVTPSNVKVWKD